jgi:hypothetical protein
MKEFHGRFHVKQIFHIFSTGVGSSDSSFVMLFVPFALLGIVYLCKLKNKIAFSIVLSLFFVFLASFTGNWPVTGRLWLFLPAIVFIFTPIGFDFIHEIFKFRIIMNTMVLILSVIIIYLSVNCFRYIGDKMYFPQQEINQLIYYVQKNIRKDEKLYVYQMAKPAFNFKNDYKTTKIGNIKNDNIIYGKNREEWNEDEIGNEILSILENKKTYLIFQHYWVGIDKGLSVLRNYGTLTEVMNVYDTPLYYFELNESKDREY